jgi:hypothetical protein
MSTIAVFIDLSTKKKKKNSADRPDSKLNT